MTVQIKTIVNTLSGVKFAESPRWHKVRQWFLDIHDFVAFAALAGVFILAALQEFIG